MQRRVHTMVANKPVLQNIINILFIKNVKYLVHDYVDILVVINLLLCCIGGSSNEQNHVKSDKF